MNEWKFMGLWSSFAIAVYLGIYWIVASGHLELKPEPYDHDISCVSNADCESLRCINANKWAPFDRNGFGACNETTRKCSCIFGGF